MEYTLTFSWYAIPTIITIVGIVWAIFIYEDDAGWLSGIGNLFMLVPALIISMISWIIAAILK